MSVHVYCRLQAVGTALTDSAQQSISGQKQSAKVEPGSVLLLPLLSLSLDHSIKKLLLMRSYRSNLYVDTFVTIAFHCMYLCMNFVHSCI